MSYIVYKYCPTDLQDMKNHALSAIDLYFIDEAVKPTVLKHIMQAAPEHYIAINRWWAICTAIAKTYCSKNS